MHKTLKSPVEEELELDKLEELDFVDDDDKDKLEVELLELNVLPLDILEFAEVLYEELEFKVLPDEELEFKEL